MTHTHTQKVFLTMVFLHNELRGLLGGGPLIQSRTFSSELSHVLQVRTRGELLIQTKKYRIPRRKATNSELNVQLRIKGWPLVSVVWVQTCAF